MGSESGSAETTTVSVLFVCMGNICRSPTGEGVFLAAVRESGFEQRIIVDSAGTIGYHTGNPADRRMSAAAKRRGIQLDGRARKVTRTDLDEFDFVIAMDRDNLDGLRSLHPSPRARLELFSHWLDTEAWPVDVPDPYYGGDDGFEYVLDMIQAGVPRLLDDVRQLLSDKKNRGDVDH